MTPQIKQRIEQIKRGEVPTGYKKTKAGIVPIEWNICELSSISEAITESVGSRQLETLSISAGIGFVNQADKFGKELSGKQYEKYTVLHKNDFSYNKGNSKKYPQGCIYRLIDRAEAAVPNVFESFRIINQSNDYYAQLFISGFLNKELSKKINHGVRDDGLLNLTGYDFYKSVVVVPPLAEQEKIAKILQTQDKIIELQQKKIEELKKLKKIYLSKMFPKKGQKVPEWRFKGFTDDWEQRKVGELLIERNIQAPMSDEYPLMAFIANEGVAPKGERYDRSALVTDTESKNYKKTEFGDFIYSSNNLETGSIGLNKYGKASISPVYSIFQPTGIADSDFLGRRLVRKDFINEMVKWRQGVIYGQWRIHESDFIKIEIPVPTIQEQRKIGAFLDNLDNLITLHQRKLEELKNYKKSLMQLLLTGIVRT